MQLTIKKEPPGVGGTAAAILLFSPPLCELPSHTWLTPIEYAFTCSVTITTCSSHTCHGSSAQCTFERALCLRARSQFTFERALCLRARSRCTFERALCWRARSRAWPKRCGRCRVALANPPAPTLSAMPAIRSSANSTSTNNLIVQKVQHCSYYSYVEESDCISIRLRNTAASTTS